MDGVHEHDDIGEDIDDGDDCRVLLADCCGELMDGITCHHWRESGDWVAHWAEVEYFGE